MSTLWRFLPEDMPTDGQEVWVDRGSACGPPFLAVWNFAAGGFIDSINSLLCYWFVVERWKSQLVVKPVSGYYMTGPEGGPFTPVAKSWTVQNQAADSVDWTATVDEAWVDVDNPGGTLASGAQTTVTLTPNAATEALTPGTYTATLTIAESTHGASETRSLTVIVT